MAFVLFYLRKLIQISNSPRRSGNVDWTEKCLFSCWPAKYDTELRMPSRGKQGPRHSRRGAIFWWPNERIINLSYQECCFYNINGLISFADYMRFTGPGKELMLPPLSQNIEYILQICQIVEIMIFFYNSIYFYLLLSLWFSNVRHILGEVVHYIVRNLGLFLCSALYSGPY